MLEHIFKALNEALATEKMRTQWEAERRERSEEQARELSKELEAVKAELETLQKRYKELKQGLADY